MSLDHIQLPPFLVQQLYKNSLVDLNPGSLIQGEIHTDGPFFLGNNKKKVLLVVNEPDVLYLADEDLEFLLEILTACKLSMQDIVLLNFCKNPQMNYKALLKQFSPEKILLLGIAPELLQFPLQFPFYQLQEYNHQTYLCAPSLKQLASDKQMKLQLWTSLKKLFRI